MAAGCSAIATGSRSRCEPARLTLVLVHGLEGSSDSRYIQGIAARAWDAGCNVVRMNMRTCGGTETLTPTLYHSGLSGDVGVVVRHYAERFGLERVALAGYSMGGNLVLKLAGEWGSRPPLCAVAAVCPAIDLAPGADALHEPLNRAYEWRFLRGLLARYSRKAKLFPDIYAPRKSIGPVRSIREFDNKIVARYWGFRDADDYYHRAASARVVDRIAVPTLILHAQDDPFIRLLPETRAKLLANPHITFVETRHGGHCAYLSRDPGNEIHWAEATVMRFLLAATGESSWKLTGSSRYAAGDAPVIEALLGGICRSAKIRRNAPRDLPEAAQFPALAEALTKLNAAASPVWTSKCDFWPRLEDG